MVITRPPQSTKACFPDKTKAVPLGDVQAEAARRSTKGGSSGGVRQRAATAAAAAVAGAGGGPVKGLNAKRPSFARLEDIPLAAGTGGGGGDDADSSSSSSSSSSGGGSSLKARAKRRQSRPLPSRFAEAGRLTCGVLLKKGGGHSIGGRRSWKRREFRIDVARHELSWFEPGASKGGGERLGFIPLAGSTLREVVDEKHPFRFQVSALSQSALLLAFGASASCAGVRRRAPRAPPAPSHARSANVHCSCFVCVVCLSGMAQPMTVASSCCTYVWHCCRW